MSPAAAAILLHVAHRRGSMVVAAPGSTSLWLLYAIVFGIELAIVVGITVPFIVALTWVRVNYLPKAVSLDKVLEDGQEPMQQHRTLLSRLLWWRADGSPRIGPEVQGVLPMMRRIRRMEGMRGLYRGTTLVVVQTMVDLAVALLFIGSKGLFSGRVRPMRDYFGFSGILFTVVASLVSLPLDVLVRRTMVHPRMLNWSRPQDSLACILTTEEYHQPWRIYQNSGVVAALLLRQFLAGFVTMLVRHWAMPALEPIPDTMPAGPDDTSFEGPNSTMLKIHFFGALFFFVWVLLTLTALVPLDCIYMRLLTQMTSPSHANVTASAPAPYNHQSSGTDTEQRPMLDADAAEPLISIRPCIEQPTSATTYFGVAPVEPYLGLLDCAQKMTREEGSESLARGATFTAMGYVPPIFG